MKNLPRNAIVALLVFLAFGATCVEASSRLRVSKIRVSLTPTKTTTTQPTSTSINQFITFDFYCERTRSSDD
ncbi:hypothetical protein BH23CHL5_BH23CHL5_20920 [soil metagenome]